MVEVEVEVERTLYPNLLSYYGTGNSILHHGFVLDMCPHFTLSSRGFGMPKPRFMNNPNMVYMF